MSETLYKLFGLALIALTALLLMKKASADFITLVKLGAGIVLSGACFYLIEPVISYVYELSDNESLSDLIPSVTVVLQVLCVAFLTQICASACRDCGEATMAYYVELGGKCEMLVLSLPLIKEIIDTAIKLIG